MQTKTTDRTVIIPRLHPGQEKIKAERRRFNVVCCGRRFGKNILGHDLVVETALRQSMPCAWAAPSYKMLTEDWKELSNLLAPVTEWRSEQEKQIRLIGGGIFDMWSLDNYDAIRGRKYSRFIVNEAAFVPNMMVAWTMPIRATLIDFKGDAFFFGTPKGHNGFWQLYQNTEPDWMRWQMSSYTNPHIDPVELDAYKGMMAERTYQQEIMAQFLEDGGGVFRFVMDAAVLAEKPPEQGHQYIIGADWARTTDSTVFAVLDIDTRECVYVDRMTNTDFATQRMRLKVLADSYHNALVMAESNSIGQPQIEDLQTMGVSVNGFTTTNLTKNAIIQALELAFEQRSIKIVNNADMVSELMAYESERLPSGLVRYGAPEGMHDDCVMALAIAWHAISEPVQIFI